MRAARFARDAHPERTPGEVIDFGPDMPPERPRSWEELDCPDEIELELERPYVMGEVGPPYLMDEVGAAFDRAGLSRDVLQDGADSFGDETYVIVTKQAEDCWYAGVPRGRRLVLRRL